MSKDNARLLCLLTLASASFGVYAQVADCAAGGSHYAQNLCLGKRLNDLDAELNRVYGVALAAIPASNEQDSRKDREQLRKSQRAWLAYIREDCALQGGLEGGSNSWVSTFAGLCMEHAFKARITFLKSIGDGAHGG